MLLWQASDVKAFGFILTGKYTLGSNGAVKRQGYDNLF